MNLIKDGGGKVKGRLKYIVLMFAFVLAFAPPVFANSAPTISLSLDKTDVKVGDVVNMEVKVSGDFKNARGIGFRVLVPENLFDDISYSGIDSINAQKFNSKTGYVNADAHKNLNNGFISYIAYWDKAYSGEMDVVALKIQAKISKVAKDGNYGMVISDDLEHTSYGDSDYKTQEFAINNSNIVLGNKVNTGAGSTLIVNSAVNVSTVASGGTGATGGTGASSGGAAGNALVTDNNLPANKEQISKNIITTVKQRLKNTIIMQIDNYGATIDGNLCHIYSGEKTVMPYLDKNGRTMVPIRFVAESLGAKVDWDDLTKTVTIALNDRVLKMQIGSKVYKIGSDSKTMDTEAVIKDKRTFVPVRFVAEALNKAVEWDESNKIVIITDLDLKWDLNGNIENKAVDDILTIISPIVRDFIRTEVKR